MALRTMTVWECEDCRALITVPETDEGLNKKCPSCGSYNIKRCVFIDNDYYFKELYDSDIE